MITLRLSEVASAVGGTLLGADGEIAGVTIDSRRVAPGNLFVALAGEHADGHAFVPAAREAGAAGALVTADIDDPLPRIRVADATRALGALARAWRDRFDLPVIGITGSNGKTTVKGMIGRILDSLGPCLVTAGNFNNELGLPLTLAGLGPEHRTAVIEMGAGQPGDIEYLAGIARPRVGVITNAAAAHLERLGTVAGVARTKGELVAALPADGVAVLNRDDDHFPLWKALAAPRRIVSFGARSNADVRVTDGADGAAIVLSADAWSRPVRLALPGRHNALNAAAATAIAVALGVDVDAIVAGLEDFEPTAGRLVCSDQPGGWVLLEDTYNANPASLAAGIDVLVGRAGERWLVLGDMAELGPEADALHFQSGALARRRGVERLWAIGSHARHAVQGFGDGGRWFADREALVGALRTDLRAGVVCLVKGSRSARMETVVQALKEAGEGAPCS